MRLMEPRAEGEGYNLADSALDAVSLQNIIKRIFLFLVFGILLALKQMVQGIDAVGQAGGGFVLYFKVIMKAMWHGVFLSLGSMWAIILSPSLYIQNHSWGSLVFAVFAMVVLVLFFYQPVSIFINILDGRKGHATGILLRLIVTIILVLIMSGVAYYAGGGVTLTTNLNGAIAPATVPVNNTIIENLTTGSSVIDLL